MGKKARSACCGSSKTLRKRKLEATRSQRTDNSAQRTGIDALPDDVLTSVLHRVGGRPVRRVCRRWRTAYGPLHGVCLPHLPTRRDLRALVPPASPLSRARSLFLPSPARLAPFSSAVLSALPGSFPTLRSLHLQTDIAVRPAQVPLLAPLAPHLTALTLALSTVAATACLPVALPTLRSLTLHAHHTHSRPNALQAFLRPLAPLLPTLHHFAFILPPTGHNPHPTTAAPAPSVLPLLAAMSQLTSLHLSATLTEWDHDSLALLATSWPRLASLHLSLDPDPAPPLFEPHPTPPANPHPTPDDLIAALGRRSTLTSLALNSPPAPFHHLAALSRLSSLALFPNPPAYSHTATNRVVSCLSAVSPSVRLTRLTIHDGCVQLTAQALFTLAPLAPTLRHFSFTGLVGPFHDLYPLATLTALRTLRLQHTGHDPEPPPGLFALPTAHVAHRLGTSLRHVTSLSLRDGRCVWPVDALLAAVAAHGRLRLFETDRYLPHLAALLAPVSATLARLAVSLPPCNVSSALQSLAGMAGVRALLVTLNASEEFLTRACTTDPNLAGTTTAAVADTRSTTPVAAACTRPQPASSTTPGPLAVTTLGTMISGAGATARPNAAATSSGASASTRSSKRACRGKEAVGRGPQAPPPLLPPGVQVLVIDLRQLDAALRGQLQEAAKSRGCVVWEKAREAEHDDCNGCLEGAAVGFVSHRD